MKAYWEALKRVAGERLLAKSNPVPHGDECILAASACLDLSRLGRRVEDNLAYTAGLLRQRVARPVDLLVLPEMFCCPGIFADLEVKEAEAIGRDTLAWAGEMAHALLTDKGLWALPAPAVVDGLLYDAVHWLDNNGQVQGIYCKTHFSPYERRNLKYYNPGQSLPVQETAWGRVAALLCVELHLPELWQFLYHRGVGLIALPTMSHGPTTESLDLLLKARALDYQLYVVSANYCREPYQPGREYGCSQIVSPQGVVLASTGFREGVAQAELRLARDNFYLPINTGRLQYTTLTLAQVLGEIRRPEFWAGPDIIPCEKKKP